MCIVMLCYIQVYIQVPRIIVEQNKINVFYIQSARISLQQDVSDVFSMISWSNWTSKDSFGICLSWGFRNTLYMSNLMKFWLSYLRLKTNHSISKLDFSSITFSFAGVMRDTVFCTVYCIRVPSILFLQQYVIVYCFWCLGPNFPVIWRIFQYFW